MSAHTQQTLGIAKVYKVMLRFETLRRLETLGCLLVHITLQLYMLNIYIYFICVTYYMRCCKSKVQYAHKGKRAEAYCKL